MINAVRAMKIANIVLGVILRTAQSAQKTLTNISGEIQQGKIGGISALVRWAGTIQTETHLRKKQNVPNV